MPSAKQIKAQENFVKNYAGKKRFKVHKAQQKKG